MIRRRSASAESPTRESIAVRLAELRLLHENARVVAGEHDGVQVYRESFTSPTPTEAR